MNNSIREKLNIDPKKLNAYSSGLLQGIAYRALNDELTRVLFQFNIAIPAWKLIGQLHDHGDMKLTEVANRLRIEAPSATELIDKLERRELVTRKNQETDKRVKIIGITEKGKNLLIDIDPLVKQTMGRLLKDVTREDLVSYIKVLESIVNNSDE